MSNEQELLARALPRYEIGPEIGRGAWGVVYGGTHRELGRAVAVKQLPSAAGADAAVRRRFVAEARRVASLEHPHIVRVYDYVEVDGVYAIVMELADGDTLKHRQRGLGLGADEAVATAMAVAIGLHHAHLAGILHRDVKPDNVLYGADGTVKVADFGIAKAMNEADGGQTLAGSLVGSPAYMAPEQITGGELSASTDVYALGIMLYELLAGRSPFPTVTDTAAVLYQQVNEPPVPLREARAGLPARVCEVVDRALSKSPTDRPSTAEQFAMELASAATQAWGPGWLARSGVNVLGATGVIAATERNAVDDHAAQTFVVENATSTGPTERSSRLVPTLLGVAALLVLVVGAIVVFSGGGDDDGPAITAAEEQLFLSRCMAAGVADETCACALPVVLDQVEADVIREQLDVMADPDAGLDPRITGALGECRTP